MLNFDDLLRISTAFWCSPFDYLRSFQCRRVHICFLKLSVPRLRKMPVLRCYPGLQWSSLFRSRVRLDTTCFLLSWLCPLFTALFFSHNWCLVRSSCLEGDRKKGSSELDSHSGRNDLAWSTDANLRERYQCFLWHHKGLNPWIVHFSELLQHADPLIQDHSCCKHTTTVIAGLTARGRLSPAENQVVKTVQFYHTVHTLLFAFSSDCENRCSSLLTLTFCLLPFPRRVCHFLSLWSDHLSLFWLSDSTTHFLRTADWQIFLAAA